VVLCDAQDNSGAGGTSDTTGLLRALVEGGAQGAVIGHLTDPAAARAAHEAGIGARLTLALGGKLFTAGDPPFEAEFEVTGLSEGRFLCTGPFYGGTNANLGKTAVLTTAGVSVVVCENRMQAADKEMFRHIGIEPADVPILGLKSAVHFRGDFTDIAETILVVEAPGAFVDNPARNAYRNLRPGVRLGPHGAPFGG
jgi:microcystin degradation protein MlrC